MDPSPPPTHDCPDLEAACARESVRGRLFPSLARPLTIGRYRVGERLGAGGMGVVFAGHDPQLDRPVALKILNAQAGDAQSKARLVHEARAMARLSHPNVVQVHDVGEHEGRVYVAMELIDGWTLEDWLRADERPWSQILARFIAAGRGLEAAHAAGLVHRDFKPENVFVGDEGQTCVGDFGLAHASEVERSTLLESVTQSGEHELLTTATRAGTPAYMSPEQLLGDLVDARSDQFSFCVALYYGLYGIRPFPGTNLTALRAAVLAGRLRTPPTTEVPSRVQAAIRRGLAFDPADRFASMTELLAQLSDDRALRRRRWIAAAVGIAALGLAGIAVGQASLPTPDACAEVGGALDEVWSPQRKAEVEAAVLTTGLGHAAQTWALVEARLDDYAERWLIERQGACRATQRGEQSERLLDLRMACYDQRLASFDDLVSGLEHGEPAAVERAVEVSYALPALVGCNDLESLAPDPTATVDPALAATLAVLRRDLSLTQTSIELGLYERATALSQSVCERADTLDDDAIRAEAWATRGALERARGDYAAAESALERAYDLAVLAGHTEVSAAAASELVELVGEVLARDEDAAIWAKSARPLALADGRPQAEARFHEAMGAVHGQAGDPRAARADYERALELWESVLEPGDPRLARALNQVGKTAIALSEHDRGRAAFDRALAITEAALGPKHPQVASVLHNLGRLEYDREDYARARAHYERELAIRELALANPDHALLAASLAALGRVATRQQRFDEAHAHHRRALEVRERVFGPEHPLVADSLNSIGILLDEQGDYDQARRYYLRSLAVIEATQGAEHPSAAGTLNNLGALSRALGRDDEALGYYARAIDIWVDVLGPAHLNVGLVRANMGAVAHALARNDEAREHYTRALEIFSERLGPEHVHVAYVGAYLGEVEFELGDLDAAVATLERSLALAEASGLDEQTTALVHDYLGRCLWQRRGVGQDRGHARDLLARAWAGYAEDSDWHRARREQLDAWLRASGLAELTRALP